MAQAPLFCPIGKVTTDEPLMLKLGAAITLHAWLSVNNSKKKGAKPLLSCFEKLDQATLCLLAFGKYAKTLEMQCTKNPTYSRTLLNPFNSLTADLKFQCNGGYSKANY
jgi:hypothetical protein